MNLLRAIFITASFFLFGCKKESDDVDSPKSEQYIMWEFNGTKVIITSPSDNFNFFRWGIKTQLGGNKTPASLFNTDIFFEFEGDQIPGIYNIQPQKFGFYHMLKNYNAGSPTMQVKVTEYGENIDDFIVGSFYGTVTDWDQNIYSVIGYFKIKIF
jgi:hypothetical protein